MLLLLLLLYLHLSLGELLNILGRRLTTLGKGVGLSDHGGGQIPLGLDAGEHFEGSLQLKRTKLPLHPLHGGVDEEALKSRVPLGLGQGGGVKDAVKDAALLPSCHNT